MDELDRFKQPFSESEIHWRIGRKSKEGNTATALAYINARDAMKRLDEVVGIGGWQDEYQETATGRVICKLSVKIGDQWITKSDGAGGTNVEGEKGGISDAFKRAAVKFGIGRYLYYLDGSRYLPIDKWGKFTAPPQLPNWAKPKKEKK
jgi:hypothetical protein